MLSTMIGRRALMLAGAGALLGAKRWDSPHFELRDLVVGGFGRRMVLLVPRHTGDTKLPLAVLLHGYGESKDERAGAWAWVERYGLADAYRRLREAPLAPVLPKLGYWKKERLEALNDGLGREPFRGLVLACPFVPNVYGAAERGRWLDDYAAWLVESVLPRARREAPVVEGAAHTSLDGVSMGGYVGIEVFLRKPEHFGSWGTVQGALPELRIDDYAARLHAVVERHGKRPMLVETSEADTYRAINERLSRALRRRGVPHDFVMPPGPHTQPFLQESGTPEMLLWHDRLPR